MQGSKAILVGRVSLAVLAEREASKVIVKLAAEPPYARYDPAKGAGEFENAPVFEEYDQ